MCTASLRKTQLTLVDIRVVNVSAVSMIGVACLHYGLDVSMCVDVQQNNLLAWHFLVQTIDGVDCTYFWTHPFST